MLHSTRLFGYLLASALILAGQAKPGAAATPAEMLRGVKGASVTVEAPKDLIRGLQDEIASRLGKLRIPVLPGGSYPMLTLRVGTLGAETRDVAYTIFSIHLQLEQLATLPNLPSRPVPVTTWQSATFGWTPSYGLAKLHAGVGEVLRDFESEYDSGNPSTGLQTFRDGGKIYTAGDVMAMYNRFNSGKDRLMKHRPMVFRDKDNKPFVAGYVLDMTSIASTPSTAFRILPINWQDIETKARTLRPVSQDVLNLKREQDAMIKAIADANPAYEFVMKNYAGFAGRLAQDAKEALSLADWAVPEDGKPDTVR